MSEPRVPTVPAGHEDPTQPAPERQGRIVVVTYNPIAAAVVAIAEQVGRPTTVLDHRDAEDSDGYASRGDDVTTDPATWLADHPLGADDALVCCDHDAPQTLELLRSALDGEAGYVAMMGSRRRAESVFATLQEESLPDETLRRLHVPAGLNIGGKAPGEIALSVVAEIVASSYGRSGAPMRDDVG